MEREAGGHYDWIWTRISHEQQLFIYVSWALHIFRPWKVAEIYELLNSHLNVYSV